jgi:hypothetical protein
VRATSTLARLGQRRYRHKTGDLPGATRKAPHEDATTSTKESK